MMVRMYYSIVCDLYKLQILVNITTAEVVISHLMNLINRIGHTTSIKRRITVCLLVQVWLQFTQKWSMTLSEL